MAKFAAGDGRQRGMNNETRKFRELCRLKTPTALNVLLDTIEDKEQHIKLRIECAKYILDQGHGKAPNFVAIGDGPINPDMLGLGELDALILEHLGANTALDMKDIN